MFERDAKAAGGVPGIWFHSLDFAGPRMCAPIADRGRWCRSRKMDSDLQGTQRAATWSIPETFKFTSERLMTFLGTFAGLPIENRA